MFCPNCGAKLPEFVYDSEVKIDKKVADSYDSFKDYSEVVDANKAKRKFREFFVSNLYEANHIEQPTHTRKDEDIHGICAHCGNPIPKHLGENDVKKLNQVAHNKFHSARNSWNTGMCGLVGGAILLAIAAIFFILCFKVAENYRFSTQGEPFIVFVALTVISVLCFAFGGITVGLANRNKKIYSKLIKNIQNRTFVQ